MREDAKLRQRGLFQCIADLPNIADRSVRTLTEASGLTESGVAAILHRSQDMGLTQMTLMPSESEHLPPKQRWSLTAAGKTWMAEVPLPEGGIPRRRASRGEVARREAAIATVETLRQALGLADDDSATGDLAEQVAGLVLRVEALEATLGRLGAAFGDPAPVAKKSKKKPPSRPAAAEPEPPTIAEPDGEFDGDTYTVDGPGSMPVTDLAAHLAAADAAAQG